MPGPKILYVEDDQTLRYITKENLERNGYEVLDCENGRSGLECFNLNNPDICILDVMMPELDGFTMARRIRERNKNVPILFVTAKTMREDRIEGLLLGADDYIVKPFSIEELILKIEIFLRRSGKNHDYPNPGKIETGDLTLDMNNLVLRGVNFEVKLTQREADLMAFFINNQNQLLSRETILESLWGENDYFMGRSLDVFISKLRKYIKNEKDLSIENRHGIGFIFRTGSK